MSRLQSFILTTTFLVCLVVGLWASQRSISAKPALTATPVTTDDAGPPLGLEDSDVIPAVATETALSPRKLTDEDALPATDHPVRRVIDRFLPKASAEERQIWFEEFRDLPVSAVEDLLRLRNESNATAPLQTMPEPLPSAENSENVSIPSVLLKYRDVLKHNLVNADTPGYRALRMEWAARPLHLATVAGNEFSDTWHYTGMRIETHTGGIEETDRPLDVAITTVGWFVVEDVDGKPAYTRHGALQMNEHRELTLPAIPDRRPLSPRVTIPEQTAHIFIDANGVLYRGTELDQWDTEQPLGQILLARFFDDSALMLHADGLYRPTLAAGTMSRAAPGKQTQVLRAKALERSNVNRESTEQALRRIEAWTAIGQ